MKCQLDVRRLCSIAWEPAVGGLDIQPLIGRQGDPHLGPTRPQARDVLHDRRVADEIAMISEAQGEGVSRARRWVDPNPELRGLTGTPEGDGPASTLAHRVHVELRQQVEAGPADRA